MRLVILSCVQCGADVVANVDHMTISGEGPLCDGCLAPLNIDSSPNESHDPIWWADIREWPDGQEIVVYHDTEERWRMMPSDLDTLLTELELMLTRQRDQEEPDINALKAGVEAAFDRIKGMRAIRVSIA